MKKVLIQILLVSVVFPAMAGMRHSSRSNSRVRDAGVIVQGIVASVAFGSMCLLLK